MRRMTAVGAQPGPRSRGLRWWHGIIAAALVIVPMLVIGVWMAFKRSEGLARYEAVTVAIRQRGHPATEADFLALIPPVDAAQQERWQAWQSRFQDESLPNLAALEGGELTAWVVGQRPQPPAALMLALRSAESHISEARTVLRRGTLTLGVLGWAATDIAAGPPHTVDLISKHCVNLLVCRSLALWLRQDALLATDPDNDLEDLERLTTALSRPGCLIDALVALAIARMRDECLVQLAYAGRLPREAEERWCREPARALIWMADGFRGDRLWLRVSSVASLRQNLFGYLANKNAWTSYGRAVHEWVYGGEEAARLAEVEDHIETRLRQSDPGHGAIDGLRPLMAGSPYLSYLSTCPYTALREDALQRADRIAVRVLDLVRQGTPLPETANELIARCGDPGMLAHGASRLGLTYQRLSPDRFRLEIDAQVPPPDYGDAALAAFTADRVSNATRNTSAHATSPLLLGSMVEIQVPSARHGQDGSASTVQQGVPEANGNPSR
jgi:hypothetical protein